MPPSLAALVADGNEGKEREIGLRVDGGSPFILSLREEVQRILDRFEGEERSSFALNNLIANLF